MSKNKSNGKIALVENLTCSAGMLSCVLPSTTLSLILPSLHNTVIATGAPRVSKRSVHHTSQFLKFDLSVIDTKSTIISAEHALERSHRYLGREVEVLVEDRNPKNGEEVYGTNSTGTTSVFSRQCKPVERRVGNG